MNELFSDPFSDECKFRRIMALSLRILGLIALSLCSLTQAHADKIQREDAFLRFGFIAGGGFVDWVGDDADGRLPGERAVSKPGFIAGLTAALYLSELVSHGVSPFRLALQPEVLYSTKGAGIQREGENRGSFYLSYLQAGLLVRAEYSTGGKVTPYFLLGPELGFLQQAELQNRFGDTEIKNDFKSTDLGLILGLGTMYSLPPWGAVGLELRGDLGLVSIDGQGDGDEIRNAALTLLLVYLY